MIDATNPPTYRLTLDLRVLDHLGIKLYSNAAAVLSEVVANAWDADAGVVKIDIGPDSIVIEDDGIGMELQQINDRFLSVGYDKRTVEGETSKKGRAFMGRKGIGKLALFSIADEIEVHTHVEAGEAHAFKMRTDDIRQAVKKGETYFPVPIEYDGPTKGTRIVLRELRKKRTGSSIAPLRKRIARRFAVIGYKSPNGDQFDVQINGEPVGPTDREDLRAVRARGRVFREPQALSERGLLLGADLRGDGAPRGDVPGAVRDSPHGGLARAVARDVGGSRTKDRPTAADLHRARAAGRRPHRRASVNGAQRRFSGSAHAARLPVVWQQRDGLLAPRAPGAARRRCYRQLPLTPI